jgi:hypothetical protein
MHRKNFVLSCAIGLLFLPGRDADALWKYLGELSGPGPFYGIDFVFPWSLSRPDVTISLNNANLLLLRDLGVHSVWLSSSFEPESGDPGFGANRAHQLFVEREFGIILVPTAVAETARESRASPSRPRVSAEDFVSATAMTEQGNELALLRSFLTERQRLEFTTTRDNDVLTADARLEVLNELSERILTERLRDRLEHYGAGTAGLFNSQLAIPKLANEINNVFFSLSLGLAFAAENNIDHAGDFDGDKDVVWLSLYPALEWRFATFADGDGSVFVNAGPAVNYFSGAQFDDFAAVSVRARLGVQIWRIYGGLELNTFVSALSNDRFGGLSDGTDLDRVATGGFLTIDLTRRPKKLTKDDSKS